jgi:hypothetical protein
VLSRYWNGSWNRRVSYDVSLVKKAGEEQRNTYWDLREVLQCTLLPGIVDQSFPLAIEGILRIGRAWGVTALAAILAGQMEEAGGTVIGDDTLLI